MFMQVENTTICVLRRYVYINLALIVFLLVVNNFQLINTSSRLSGTIKTNEAIPENQAIAPLRESKSSEGFKPPRNSQMLHTLFTIQIGWRNFLGAFEQIKERKAAKHLKTTDGISERLHHQTKILDTWSDKQYKTSMQKIKRNISPSGATKGAMCASPSKSNPDYFYHWTRDSALTMNFLAENLDSTKEAYDNNVTALEDYVSFSKIVTSIPNTLSGLGEPKYNMDGTAFNENWGRPQNDGPALRAICLINYANHLISQRKPIDHLYCNSSCIINRDLDYIAENWKTPSFEIWEEVKGIHYYTTMVQIKALEMGQLLSSIFGDFETAKRYHFISIEMIDSLEQFWDSRNQIIRSTVKWSGGLPSKINSLDSQVILALLHTWDPDTTFYRNSTFTRTLSTATNLFQVFTREYKINSVGLPAISMGRYPNDKYNGYDSKTLGNPWPLITMGIAELYYKLAYEITAQQCFTLDYPTLKFVNYPVQPAVKAKIKLSKKETILIEYNTPQFWDIAKALFYNGEEFLKRVKHHTAKDGSISEQWNRNSGFNQGAQDLTWSYTAFCTMKLARDKIKNALFKEQ